MKISFDFDGVLTRPSLQKYAKELLDRGYEIWIVTSRLGFGKEPTPTWNDDLFAIAESIGISKDNIHFCCMENKSEFLKDKDFIFHIDDDNFELSLIKKYTKVKPIYLFGNKYWKEDCENAIYQYCNFNKKNILNYNKHNETQLKNMDGV